MVNYRYTTEPLTQMEEGGGFVEEFGKGVVRGFLNVGQGLVGTAEWIIPGEQESLIEAQERIGLAKERVPMTHSGASAWAGRVLGEALPYMGSAMVAGYAGGGVAAGVGGKVGVGQAIGAATIGFSVEGQAAYDEAIKGGATKKQANTERLIVGTINAAIEAAQISRLLKFHKSGGHSLRNFVRLAKTKAWDAMKKEGKSFTADILKMSLTEALEEFTQEGVSMLTPGLLRKDYPKKPDGTVDTWAIVQQLGGAALGGGFAGGVLGGAGAMIGGAKAIAAPTTKEMTDFRTRIEESKLPSIEKRRVLNELGKWEDKLKIEEPAEAMPVEGEPAKPVDEVGPVDIETQDKKLNDMLEGAIKEVEELRPEQAKKIKQARAKSFKAYEELLKSEPNPIKAQFLAKSALKNSGLLPITPFKDRMSENDISTYFTRVNSSTAITTEKIHMNSALTKLFFDGKIPEPAEINSLRIVFPSDTVNKLVDMRRKYKRSAFDFVANALQIPRSILASCDFSAIGRQGALLAVRRPVKAAKAAFRGVRAALSPKYTNFMDLKIRTDPFYESANKARLELTRVDGLSESEEVFRGEFAHKIPVLGKFIEASERAYVTTLNSLRFDVYKHYAQNWQGTGKTTEDYKTLAKYINHATGRGKITKLEPYMKSLNVAFFAPRLAMSRVQVLTDLFTTSPVRKIIAADLVTAIGSGMLALWLASLIKGVTVERDPRSSDFGKIRFGNSRIDFWAGYQQIARYTAQLMMGEVKSTTTGRKYKVRRPEVAWRFIQSKLAPPVGFAVDMVRGETFLGKQIGMEDIDRELFERFTPLFIQDVVDAIRFQGLSGAGIIAPLALHGVGAMTYPVTAGSEASRIKNVYSQQVFGEGWDEVGPEAQKLLREYEPNIELAEIKAKLERENFSFLERMAKEQKAAGENVVKDLPKDVRSEINNLSVDVKGFSRRISSNWYLNEKRYEQYQSDTVKMLEVILPKIVGSSIYKALPSEAKRLLLEEIIDDIKKEVRNNIVSAANINDLEKL